jgi:pSer/pThr/pTyr-binding forkhead associated (FHA) protein
VAEYTFGLILSTTRGIAAAHHALRYTDRYTARPPTDAESRRDATAQWSLDPGAPFDTFQGPELLGRTIGQPQCSAPCSRLPTLSTPHAPPLSTTRPFSRS